MGVAPKPPLRDQPPWSWRPATAADPDQCPTRVQGASPVDPLQTILGDVLLALAGLALVLLAVILVLTEAHIILRLGRKLTQRVSEEQGGR